MSHLRAKLWEISKSSSSNSTKLSFGSGSIRVDYFARIRLWFNWFAYDRTSWVSFGPSLFCFLCWIVGWFKNFLFFIFFLFVLSVANVSKKFRCWFGPEYTQILIKINNYTRRVKIIRI